MLLEPLRRVDTRGLPTSLQDIFYCFNKLYLHHNLSCALRDYDAKKFKCYPWHGQRGPSWERYFKPEFENAIRDVKDNFSNLHQWLFGMDFGGWAAGAPAHIAGAGPLATSICRW